LGKIKKACFIPAKLYILITMENMNNILTIKPTTLQSSEWCHLANTAVDTCDYYPSGGNMPVD